MLNQRLTWTEIKQRYPSQYVGLVDVESNTNTVSVKTAIVRYTSKNTTYENLLRMAMCREIILRYTTPDEDELKGVLGWENLQDNLERPRQIDNYTQTTLDEWDLEF